MLLLNYLRSIIKQAVKQADFQLRCGAREVLLHAQQQAIPILVFSAGLADVIEEVLIQNLGSLARSTQIIGNRMLWDPSSGVICGFSEPTIHGFNKNQSHVPHRPNRPHEILLGDSIGDVTMCDGAPNPPSLVLKVGFLNNNVDENLERYKEIYDILILNDGDMSPVTSILHAIERE